MNNINPRKLRISGENIILLTTIVVGTILGFILFHINLWLTIGLIIIGIIYVILENSSFIGNALLITNESIPNAYQILQQSAKKLSINAPNMYIQQSPVLNAFVIGLINPSIVITSGLYDVLESEELKFVISHELGHILLKHNIISTIIYPTGNGILFLNYLFDFWTRYTEYSADRIGLFCSYNLNATISCLTKISVGQKVFKTLKENDFMQQIKDINTVSEKIGETLFNHPYTVNRIARLVNFNEKLL